MAPKRKPPVTSANTRQERIKNRGKAPASTPKPRQTAVGNRGAQAGPLKPGTRTSGTPMVNSSSATMRQIQAKATELRNQVNRGVRAARQPATLLPNSVRAGRNLIREGAQRLRTIGDSGQVRAAAEQGRKAVETAQRNRARRAAGVGRGAKELQAVARVAGLARGLSPATVAYETLKARPTAKGTISAGGVQGPVMPKRLEQQGLAAQEKRARQKNEARKKATGSSAATPNTAKSFDSAFKDARRAKVSTFTWQGKKYTTKMK